MRARVWVAFAAVSVLWGVPYFFIKLALAELSPGFLAWSRVAIGVVLLLPVAWRAGALRGLWSRRAWLLTFTLTEITIPWVLIPVGERWVSSSLTAILIAAVPLTVGLLAIRMDPAERPTGLGLAGLLIGLAGVVALVGIDVAGRPLELLGAACILVATLGYALSTIIVRRHLADLHPLGPVTAALTVSALVLAPLAFLSPPRHLPSAQALASLAVLGTACTALGLVLFFFLIVEAGATRAAIVTYVNPAVAVLLGVVLLGERLTAVAVAGLLLILAGSWLSTGGRRPPGAAAVLRRARRLLRPADPVGLRRGGGGG
ncbi:MAG TPA: DMT family transporter [Actinomycetes bacterium]|nr:DMT family transporter [Actinomycetes bacterium]